MVWFEWDEAKAQSNERKHRVRFDDAILAFGDPFVLIRRHPPSFRTQQADAFLPISLPVKWSACAERNLSSFGRFAWRERLPSHAFCALKSLLFFAQSSRKERKRYDENRAKNSLR
jgi:uncharacterized DUF497 family protein